MGYDTLEGRISTPMGQLSNKISAVADTPLDSFQRRLVEINERLYKLFMQLESHADRAFGHSPEYPSPGAEGNTQREPEGKVEQVASALASVELQIERLSVQVARNTTIA